MRLSKVVPIVLLAMFVLAMLMLARRFWVDDAFSAAGPVSRGIIVFMTVAGAIWVALRCLPVILKSKPGDSIL